MSDRNDWDWQNTGRTGGMFDGASWMKPPGGEGGRAFEGAMARSRLAGLEGYRAWLEWMKAAGMLEMVVSSVGQFMGPDGGGADADAFLARIDEQIAGLRAEVAADDVTAADAGTAADGDSNT